MKKLLHLLALVTAVSALAIASAPAQAKKADADKGSQSQSPAKGKITKADAERLVLQRNPGANILSSNEATVKGRQAWVVSFSTTGAPAGRKVYVDQETGKLSY